MTGPGGTGGRPGGDPGGRFGPFVPGLGGVGGTRFDTTLPDFLEGVPNTWLPGGGGGLPGVPTRPGQIVPLPDPLDLLKKQPFDFNRLPPDFTGPQFTVDPLAAQHLLPNNTTPNLQEGLEARVKDPLWFLAMQWLTGELEGENGGSVAQFEIAYETRSVTTLKRGGTQTTIDPAAPLEQAIEAEDPDHSSPAWEPTRLEYSFALGTDGTQLVVDEYDGKSLDWYHFDLETANAGGSLGAETTARLLPRNLRFEGMPHPRWWRFERAGSNLSRVVSTEPNFLQLLLGEYLLADSNNWYLAPLEQLAGDLRRLTRVTVFDSFGVGTDLSAIVDTAAASGWELFTLTPRNAQALDGSYLYVPNIAANLVQGEPAEDIELVRDEDANVVWAVERIYTNESAQRINRSDEESATTALTGFAAPATLDEEHRAMRVYRLATPVRRNWIPYLPRRAPTISGAPDPEMFLRRGRSDEAASAAAPQYRTTIVGESWLLKEEEIPRTGLRVERLWRFARGTDGSEHFWIGRRKDVLSVERSTGLDHDYLMPAP